jgi:DNA-binding PadR family transcriptional regulator
MSDKRSRGDLDLFLLALIGQGISTPYDFLAKADLSPGATLPVLKRLQERGLVHRGETGARRRSAYQVTTKGQRHLATAASSLLDSEPSDIEASFRVAVIALVSGAKRDHVAEFLRHAAEVRRETSTETEVPSRPSSGRSKDCAGWYRFMKVSYSRARLDAEANVLIDLARELASGTGKRR